MPVAEATGILKTGSFEYAGRKFPRTSFTREIQNLGTGKPAYELGPHSIRMDYQTALWQIALLTKADIDSGVPEDIKETALAHHDVIISEPYRGKGNWLNSGANYNLGVGRPNPWLPDGYDRLAIFNGIKWSKKDDIWQLGKSSDNEMTPTDTPPSGFAYFTQDGIYQASGVPFATVPEKKTAIDRSIGYLVREKKVPYRLAEQLAERYVSYFGRRGKDTGFSPAYRHSYLDGPFCLDLGWGAEHGDGWLGSFPPR